MSVSLTTITIVPGKSNNRNDSLIQISNPLIQALQLEIDEEIKISLGQKIIYLQVQTIDSVNYEIHFPENILKELCLPIQKYKFQAKFNSENHTLYLGPVIGLLTDFHINENEDPHFRSVHTFCGELHQQISENGGFFYVFAYHEYLSRGYYFENGKWISAKLPLPDVVYNRIHSRRLEQNNHFKNFRKKLDQSNIPIFNNRFLSKWEVYEHLIKDDYPQSFVPETGIFSEENLYEFAQKYKTVFIKPVHGSQGRNIFKIEKEDDLHYSFQSSIKSKADQVGKKYSLKEIYQQIQPFIHNRIYIIQQGIPLVTAESCAMDFRVLCHKNQFNFWEVTSIVARISAEQEFVSNIARGGRILKPLNALSTCMNKRKALEVIANMKELSIETASIISKHSPGITGELGIDIGVGKDGKLWLIEVNSKPSKNFEDGLGKIRPSAKSIIEYCTALAFNTDILKEEL
ncbi:YheC/YheD family endospore coat-associated protein [Neobacillus ginsengisoli]|uniref:Glutathione synthase/RimK-type ligase-like ATP-grasp enzyme n=1 Tax=Neobacillus ginsengisoli TaxID=904295 RepID=A0ABT9XRA4_9BACI|nr:YheC/YheD family protein [Neobacillus ginsengisoli]MDQ0198096.1 glutathione synthase/RimK-type ligase-like ATP-grasp enzyme [Neobacillus ginsengisoli]